MGTTKEWVNVALAGGFWGAFMLLLFALGEGLPPGRQRVSLRSVLVYGVGGLLFGIWTTFHGRAFRWPLVLVTILAILSMFRVARLKTSNGSKGDNAPVSQ
jgi:hypothetical protein